ncbi:hypothetical protein D1872_289520 [compost metagenome]
MGIGIEVVDRCTLRHGVILPELSAIDSIICSEIEFTSHFCHIHRFSAFCSTPYIKSLNDPIGTYIIFIEFRTRTVTEICSEK